MVGRLLIRTAVLVVVAIASGAVYAHLREQKSPLVLRAHEAEKLDLSKYTKATPEPASPSPANDKPDGQQEPANTKPAPLPSPPDAPAQPAPQAQEVGLHVTIEQAKLLYDNRISFLDARHLDEYEAGHVDNSFLLSSDDVTGGKGDEVLGYLDKNSPIVVYCNGGACDASENLVKVLQVLGYKGCRIMTDGYPAWQKAGYPTGTGKPLVGGG